MKRILFIIVGILISWSIFELWKTNTPVPAPESQSSQITHTPTIAPTKTVQVNAQETGYAYILTAPSQVSLLTNFQTRTSARELMETQNCESGVNAGFYDTEGQPLGLFIADGQTLNQAVESKLLNGFFAVTPQNNAEIVDSNPKNARLAVQTGPLLMLEGSPLPLRILSDERARRMVAATTTNGEVVFLTLFSPDSVFDGPLLADTPVIVSEIAKQEGLSLTRAINLDGGSASAFYNQTISLAELTQVGSFFCVKRSTIEEYYD